MTLTVDGVDGINFQPIELQLPQPGDISASEIHVMGEGVPTSRRRSIPPEFSTELDDQTIEEGDCVEMQIFVTGTPPPEVVWYKDDQPITIYPHRRFHATRVNDICSLEIKDARCSDQGNYTCRAKNTAGEVRKSCKLTVKQVTPTSPPAFVKQLKDVYIVEGSCTRFDVKVTGMPEPEVTWYKDGHLVKKDKHMEIVHDEDTSALIVMYGKPDDAGDYTCKAVNEAGEAESSARLHISPLQVPAKFTSPVEDVNVFEGETVKLKCTVIGRPDPNVTWFKDNQQLHESSKFRMNVNPDNTCVLAIENVDLEDEGSYTCTATNSAGKDTCSGKLTVNGEGKFPEFTKVLENAEIPDGSPVRFDVHVTGKPTPVVEWLKGIKVLKPGPRFETQSSGNCHTFVITNCRDDDSGNYTCKAKNKFGTATCDATLVVAEDTVPPRFTKKLYDSTADAGNTVEFSVKYIGSPEPKVKWYLDDEEVSEDDEGMDIETEPGSSLLVLEDIAPNDSGQYKCIITNIAGKAVTSAQLKVVEEGVKSTPKVPSEIVKAVGPVTEKESSGSTPVFVKKLSTLHAIEGDAVRLEVIVDGTPKPSVQWFVENDLVVEDRHTRIIKEGNVHALVISKTVLDDEAEYKCVAENSHGQVECTAELLVDELTTKPEFVKQLKPLEVKAQCDAVFEVKVHGKPEPDVSWFQNNVPVRPGGRYVINAVDDLHTLIIRDTTPKDSGEVKCQAKNDAGKAQSVAPLLVMPAAVQETLEAPTFLKKPQNARLVEGGSTSFEVQVDGTPTPTVTWYTEEDEEIPELGHIRCLSDGTLVIDKAELDDEGFYKCVASNKAGEVSCKVEVIVDEAIVEEIPVSQRPEVESEIPIEGLLGVSTEEVTQPVITKKLQDLSVTEGDTVKFEVEVIGNPKPVAHWETNGAEIMGNEETVMETSGDSHRLTLRDVVPDDEGEYTFTATNEAGKVSCKGKLLVHKRIVKPSFLYALRDVEVNENSDVRLEVRVQGTEPDIEWYRNGVVIEETTSRTEFVENEERGSYAYLIYGAKTEDQGTYRCTAVNEAGEASCEGKLTVRENVIPPRFLQRLENRKIVESTAVDLEVEVSGRPKPTVRWLKDGDDVTSDDHLQMDTEGRIHTLSITRCRLSDGGTYSCVASNSGGRDTCSATLEVEKEMHAPEFVVQPAGAQIVEGGEARFEAFVSGLPEPEIEWFKDGKLIRDSHRFKLEFDDNKSVLTIKDAEQIDDGEFTCTATNKVGKVSCTVELVVGEAIVAPEFVKKMSSIELCEEDLARFEVRVSGTPQPEVQWFKNGRSLEGDERYEFHADDDMHSLELSNCLLSDGGLYNCTATNEAGQTSCSGELTVIEKLIPPVFTDEPTFPKVMDEGGDIVLEAIVDGKPVPTVEWVKVDNTVKNSAHFNIKAENGKHTLTISGAGPGDSGVYKCVANNPAGSTTRTFNVNIEGKSFLLVLLFVMHLGGSLKTLSSDGIFPGVLLLQSVANVVRHFQ